MQEESARKSVPEFKIIEKDNKKWMEDALNEAAGEGWEIVTFQTLSVPRNGIPKQDLHFSALLRRHRAA